MKNLLVALLLLPSLPAFASSCKDSVTKKGNVFSGTTYSASVSVPNLGVASALGQMRAIVTAKGYEVLTEDAEGGSMMIERPDQVKAEMCKILDGIFAGKAGTQIASQAGNASAPKPMVISATALSDMLTRQANDNLAAVDVRYQGKVFKVSGHITGTMAAGKGRYNVGFVSSDYKKFDSVAVTCGGKGSDPQRAQHARWRQADHDRHVRSLHADRAQFPAEGLPGQLGSGRDC